MAQFAGNAHWAEPSPLFAYRARPTLPKRKNEYWVLELGEETAVQAVVGFIDLAFRRLKKPTSQEMSARGYGLHSVCSHLSLFSFLFWINYSVCRSQSAIFPPSTTAVARLVYYTAKTGLAPILTSIQTILFD